MATASAQKSTTVRTQVPSWLRAGLHGLEAVFPPLASEVAERMLLTPIRHRTPRRERALVDAARILSLPWWPRGAHLTGYAWGEGPPVLLVHGWAGRATQLGAFVAPLVAAGHTVVGFDLPAHGRSDGERATIIDLRDALVAIGRAHGPFAAVIAHSMGAAAATMAIAEGLQAERLVLISAPASLRDQTRRFARAIGVSQATLARVTERIENRLRIPLDTIEVEAVAERVHAPTLVVHDEGDEEVPIAAAERIATVLPSASLHRTRGLGHHKVLREPAVVGHVAEFITGARVPAAAPTLDAVLDRELFDPRSRRL
jgi:pimeloyl-ACP methyl ester carboxylesterase